MAEFRVQVNGVEELNKLLKSLATRVEKQAKEMINAMRLDGEDYAMNYLGHIDTAETLNSITSYRRGRRGVIIAGGNAIWVEFGTGVIRNSSEHPEVVESGVPIYPHGGYGKGKGKHTQGWWYYSKVQPNHRDYTKAEDGGYLVHTNGIEQNMFMYHTYEKLVDQLPDYAKEFMKEVFK